MKVIQTMADVLALKADERLPSFYVGEVEHQFLMLYIDQNEGESFDEFVLSSHSCIYHFDKEEDMQMLIDNIDALEYVDVERVDGRKYYRVCLMHEHHLFSIIFILEGTLPQKTERWLER